MKLFLKNLLFTLVLPGTMGVYIPLIIARGSPAPAMGSARQLAGAAMLAAGAAIYFWCLWYFAMDGRATPAPIDAPKTLVIKGPYRYVRNPMYLGVGLAIAGWAVWFWISGIAWFMVAWWVNVMLFVRFYEEPTLHRLFAEQYERYCASVRRWVPGKPWSGA